MARAWAIKLGSGGRCVPFCERHNIVGLGWETVDGTVLKTASRADLAKHVAKQCPFYTTAQQRGNAVGQLWRFARECAIGDYILYYDPPNKHVRLCRVASDIERRTFEPSDASHFCKCAGARDPLVNSPRGNFRGNARSHVLRENRKRSAEAPSGCARGRSLASLGHGEWRS